MLKKNVKDNLTNWYDVANKNGNGFKMKVDKNYKKHLIKPCQMIGIFGKTGAGKSTAIVEFLSRKNDTFFEITIFTGSTADEPLYKMLEEKIEGIFITNDIEELPELIDMNEFK